MKEIKEITTIYLTKKIYAGDDIRLFKGCAYDLHKLLFKYEDSTSNIVHIIHIKKDNYFAVDESMLKDFYTEKEYIRLNRLLKLEEIESRR